MRVIRLACVLLLLVAAVFAALLAADVRSWRDAVHSGDVRYAQRQADVSWSASTTLPVDPALRILGLSGELAFRRAAQSFVTVEAAGNGVDNGYSESQARGNLETVLTRIAAGSDRRQSSEADNLLGILAFADSRKQGPGGPAPVERSVSDFQAAVQLDPGNDDAKLNLELLLRELVARGARPGSNASSSGPGKGHQGAGGGLPGSGY